MGIIKKMGGRNRIIRWLFIALTIHGIVVISSFGYLTPLPSVHYLFGFLTIPISISVIAIYGYKKFEKSINLYDDIWFIIFAVLFGLVLYLWSKCAEML